MAAKYRKIDPRIWNDEKFRKLTEQEKLIAFYCLTAQCNRAGIFPFSPARAAEELEMNSETFGKRFGNVCDRLNWSFDRTARVLYFPTWWKYNPPENGNVLIGALSDLQELPETLLLKDFIENTKYLSETLVERLRNVSLTLPQTITESGTGTGTGTGTGNNIPDAEQPAPEQEDFQKAPKASKKPKLVFEIPECLQMDMFATAWTAWVQHRIEKRNTLTQSCAAGQLKKLAGWGAARAVAALEFSTANGYTGIFEPSQNGNGNGKQSRICETSTAAEFEAEQDAWERKFKRGKYAEDYVEEQA